jgi:hypothetical protein
LGRFLLKLGYSEAQCVPERTLEQWRCTVSPVICLAISLFVFVVVVAVGWDYDFVELDR